jgi:hypothetical protein
MELPQTEVHSLLFNRTEQVDQGILRTTELQEETRGQRRRTELATSARPATAICAARSGQAFQPLQTRIL